MNHAQEANVGYRYVLAEEGGYALVEVVHREQTGNSLNFRVRFVEIYIQYPFVPYHVGDEFCSNCKTAESKIRCLFHKQDFCPECGRLHLSSQCFWGPSIPLALHSTTQINLKFPSEVKAR